jgi:hypothetical protein
MSWTRSSRETTVAALQQCKGSYQRDIILGKESISGSTLQGRAKQYSERYYHSRCSLLDRLRQHGISVRIAKQQNRHILVLGE